MSAICHKSDINKFTGFPAIAQPKIKITFRKTVFDDMCYIVYLHINPVMIVRFYQLLAFIS